MTSAHRPVLAEEVIAALTPADGDVMVDATFGAGGYSCALLAAAKVRVYGIDRDPEALAAARSLAADSGGRLVLLQGRFSEMERLLGPCEVRAVDGVTFDVGVSSMQLDDPARGFSFAHDGPLDMRMDKSGPTAADLVNKMDEAELARTLRRFGEEPRARRIAAAIVEERAKAPVRRTAQLAAIVAGAVGPAGRKARIHPATRSFQALRIVVNDELGELERGLAAAERLLRPAGRLAVVAFHSLEDRIVKRFLAERAGRTPAGSRHRPPAPTESRGASFRLPRKGAIKPRADEVAANPRARSARLRVAVRTAAPAWGEAA